MILTLALCVLVIGINAQDGPGGFIVKDDPNFQFSNNHQEQPPETNPVQISSDGTVSQTRNERSLEGALVGPSGIITSSGQLIHLEAGVSIVHAGPSGVVLSNGKNVQFV